jgi:hypothetical protein
VLNEEFGVVEREHVGLIEGFGVIMRDWGY